MSQTPDDGIVMSLDLGVGGNENSRDLLTTEAKLSSRDHVSRSTEPFRLVHLCL